MPVSSTYFKCIQADGSVLFTDQPCEGDKVSVVQEQTGLPVNMPLDLPINPLLAIVVVYVVMSIVSFIMYRTDKKRSVSGGWRIPEKTLHFIDLAGGWPGAIMAQRRFRHKTRKSSFQWVFRVIVVLHLLYWGDFVLGFPLLNRVMHSVV